MGGKIITEVITLRPKTYAAAAAAAAADDGNDHKKAKGTKKCVIKQEFVSKFQRLLVQ